MFAFFIVFVFVISLTKACLLFSYVYIVVNIRKTTEIDGTRQKKSVAFLMYTALNVNIEVTIDDELIHKNKVL